jgi:hypothetical protein
MALVSKKEAVEAARAFLDGFELVEGGKRGKLYERALAIEPHQAWAAPSALYCRYRIDGDAKHLKALEKLAKGNHGNERARALLERVDRRAAAKAKRPKKT